MKSLRLRLVLLTTAAVAVVWLLTAIFTWRSALHEIEELLNHPPTSVSHMQEERAELAGEIAEHLLMPMLVALPGLALVLVVAVGFSLRPLRRLTDDLATRAPNRLTPIASTDTPREIAPLIGRLNELFAGIDRALQNERRFTADASHELRTPLAALKAQAQVALAATDETTRRHALGQILLGCDRATHLVTQMLTLARLDADSGQAMHDIDLRPLAEAVLAATAGEAIANGCELALAEGNARVRGNAALLQSLLRNLIDNALRHGGARQIEIAIAQAGKDVVLTITDDGRGIPASEREIVTQRFRRGTGADSSDAVAEGAAGSGLGLSIVGRIVELHGGGMSLDDSDGGHGLSVRIHLPGVNQAVATAADNRRMNSAEAVRDAATRRHWHALPATEALNHHGVEPDHGLSDAEAAARLARHGPNRPTQQPGPAAWQRFLAQLREPLVLVLIGAGVVTALLGEWVDSSVIFGVVIVNAVIGYLQEGKAEAALAALARAVATEVTVVRGGKRQRMDAVHLVPGDVVWLAAGDKVPADLRILHGRQLRTVEAALTGEAAPIDKHHAELPPDTLLADRRNMAYAGTTVVAGQGHGLVIATADATETGRISGLIANAPEIATPLTRKMGEFAGLLLWVILGLAALTFAIGVLRGEGWVPMLMAAVALAVGAIPEGLPAAMSITLAIGVGRMAKRRAIIRHLPAVEALGSTTVICSDKTGTLTENAMTVTELWSAGSRVGVEGHGYVPEGRLSCGEPGPALRETVLAAALCNDAALHLESRRLPAREAASPADKVRHAGDPTEVALLVVARKAGLDDSTLRHLFPRRDELPFDSARQTMATLHGIEGQSMLYAKGAIEKILPACSAMLASDGAELPLDAAGRALIAAAAADMAARGLRVLALARRRHTGDELSDAALEEGLVFLGLAAMMDPPRKQAIAAVRTCHAAGIAVKMITGDHAETARAIALQIGIIKDAGTTEVLTGRDLARLDDAALQAAAARVNVFARVEPEQKLRLVRALQARGEVVAMTGDGVNDAPALKQADIGIAMGLGGTDVAKEAAAMVLTDDNFATIEAAVEEGRGIYDNLVKFIAWTLPTNFGEGLVILAAIIAGLTLPITPLQILWINMTTAVLLGLPLAFEPAERGIMRRLPRAPGAPVLDGALVRRIVLVGVLMLAGSFGMFLLAIERGQAMAEARTIAMNVFVAIEIVYLFSCRSLRLPVTAMSPFANPWVWVGAGLQALLQLAITYWSPLNLAFATSPITGRAWAEIGAIALVALCIVEIDKWLQNQGDHTHRRAPEHSV